MGAEPSGFGKAGGDIGVSPKRRMVALACIFGVVCLWAWARGSFGGDTKSAVNWNKDVVSGLAAAFEQKQTTFVYFGADWCPPCKVMQRETFTNKGVGQVLNKLNPVYVDVDKHPDIERAFGVMSLPTMVLIHDGKVVDARDRYMSAADMVLWLGMLSPTKTGS